MDRVTFDAAPLADYGETNADYGGAWHIDAFGSPVRAAPRAGRARAAARRRTTPPRVQRPS
jgi:hypothetical protein